MFPYCKRKRPKMLQDHIQSYMYHKRQKKPGTLYIYTLAFDTYREVAGNSWPPTVETVNRFLDALRAQGLADATVHQRFRVLRTFILWAYRHRLMPENPLDFIERPPTGKKHIPRAPARDNVELLLNSLQLEVETSLRLGTPLGDNWQAVRDLAVVSILAGTGLRVGELCQLAPSDVEFDQSRVYLSETKTDAPRYVKISPIVRGDLSLWLSVRRGLPLPSNIWTLFVSYPKSCVSWYNFGVTGVRQMLIRRCTRLKIPVINPHAFRHYFAVNALRLNASLTDVQQQLGHRHPTTTNIYAIAAGVTDDIRQSLPR